MHITICISRNVDNIRGIFGKNYNMAFLYAMLELVAVIFPTPHIIIMSFEIHISEEKINMIIKSESMGGDNFVYITCSNCSKNNQGKTIFCHQIERKENSLADLEFLPECQFKRYRRKNNSQHSQ